MIENNILVSILKGLNERLENFVLLAQFSRLNEEMADNSSYRAAAAYTWAIGDYYKSISKALAAGGMNFNTIVEDTPGIPTWYKAIEAQIFQTERDLNKSLQVIQGMANIMKAGGNPGIGIDYNDAVEAVSKAIQTIEAVVEVWDDIRKKRLEFMNTPEGKAKNLQVFPPLKLSSGVELQSNNKQQFTLNKWTKEYLPASKVNGKSGYTSEEALAVEKYLNSINSENLK